MSPSYRDDRDAALARVEALQRENDQLRAENHWLHDQLDPEETHPALARAHRRGAAVGMAMLLGALACVALVARDAASNVARAEADLAFDLDAQEREPPLPPTPAELARTLSNPAPRALPTPPAESHPAVMGLALAPLLHGCFPGVRARVDLLAAVDARGRARQVHVFVPGRSSPRAERRCVRRALASVTLPTTQSVFASQGADAELHLVVLPAASRRAHRAR